MSLFKPPQIILIANLVLLNSIWNEHFVIWGLYIQENVVGKNWIHQKASILLDVAVCPGREGTHAFPWLLILLQYSNKSSMVCEHYQCNFQNVFDKYKDIFNGKFLHR